ncbi:hypothetical protein LTR20_003145 [Exophiala xenobiotica]|nr:hypothetical protein LTS13_000218 [Exophiala xenobiotica]KAK5403355.1 hypothetical protein LTR79_000108 [Exophiala xenobiotica]KAK5422842.1 hypothetical protein LTR90_001860 [Exophiala xenobiotica]KAK5468799.1 hypothetical protein LTR20_003145 [Exophiala xenobiotica]KAK5495369.1 hypothetical protein LTR26_001985 [Exophiala xenobiotica]
MESMFTLPPPALRSNETSTQSNLAKSNSRENTTAYSRSTPPVSPQDKPLASSPRHKRTASGAVKSGSESTPSGPSNSAYALPPPPSRARKIIQMKPKSAPSPDSDASYAPPPAPTSTSNTTPKSAGATTNSKRKQPSATSAAGRKIARKTAHSVIERRRRSKMNEEFGVLKDMIPACEGVEMHKLAILQAGIEYVRYLEGCVAQLKTENEKQKKPALADMQVDGELDEREEDDDDMAEEQLELAPPARVRSVRHAGAVSNEWTFRDSRKSSVASLSSSCYPSPHILSQSQSHADDQRGIRKRPILPAGVSSYSASPSQISTNITSTTPTPTLLSPAFNSIHFSPELARTQTNSSVGQSTGSGSLAAVSTSSSWTTVNPSPSMQPLPSPKAAMHLPLPHAVAHLQLPQPYDAAQHDREAHSKSPAALSTAEATASAALMMLTNDWRGAASGPGQGQGQGQAPGEDVVDRGKGMSVKDLLSW